MFTVFGNPRNPKVSSCQKYLKIQIGQSYECKICAIFKIGNKKLIISYVTGTPFFGTNMIKISKDTQL
jgi:hypothetical protein